ncbi:MAG TPA: hypothetical protein VEC12_09100 [Bacteroidia bacterium]|nr:hypothetical protein [Bacteroidia bacterium]
MCEHDRWFISSENEDMGGLDDMKFVFEQAEKQLGETVTIGSAIADKTNNLITLIVGILIALVGYFISNWSKEAVMGNTTIVALAAICYLFICLVVTLKNIQPNLYYLPGSEPKDLVANEFYSDAGEISSGQRLTFITMSEIENYQFRIEENTRLNDNRWKRFNTTLWMLLAMPLLSTILFICLQMLR